MIQFTKEQELFRTTVREFVDQEIRPNVLQWETVGKTPRWVWKRCAELGILGAVYPAEYGGLDLDYSYTLIATEELAKCGSPGVSLGIAVQTDMATPALATHGNEEIKEKYLKPALTGEMICSIAVSEPNCGSDVAGLQTKAVKDGEEYVINGSKMWITNGTQADFITLLARTSPAEGYQSFSLFVVPTDTQGFSVSRALKKTCYPSSDTAELVFEEMRIPASHLIGKEGMGFMYQMEQFQVERLAGAIAMLGGMKRCYQLTKDYVHQREAFGQKLADMQVTQHKMAQILTEIVAVESMAHMCVQKVNRSEEFTKEASMLKLFAAQVQQRVLNECCQLHGGAGLMAEYEVARYFRDTKLAEIGGGSNEVMKKIIAKMEGFSGI